MVERTVMGIMCGGEEVGCLVRGVGDTVLGWWQMLYSALLECIYMIQIEGELFLTTSFIHELILTAYLLYYLILLAAT